jgi:hypothetical protein
MADVDIKDVNTSIEEPQAKDVSTDTDNGKGNVEEVVLTENIVSKWLTENENGKAYAKSFTDSRVSQGINTYKEKQKILFDKTVDERVETEIRKRMPNETPDQKRIREIELKFEIQEKKAKRSEMEKIALQYIGHVQLEAVPENIIYSFVTDSEDETRNRIDEFKKYILYREEKKANAILAKNSHVPQGGDDEKGVFATRKELNAAIQKAGNGWRSNPMLVKEYERFARKA